MNGRRMPPHGGEPASDRLDPPVYSIPVDYPDEAQTRLRIEEIVETALPLRPSFPAYVTEMYRQIGFRHLFRDLTEIIFVLLLGLGVLAFTALFAIEQRSAELVYAFIFTVSPLLYLAVAVLFFAELRRRDTYAVEMSCRYNVYQLASLRMLVFAAVCLLLNGALVCWIAAVYGELDLLRGLLLSASSLILFAAAFLYGMLRGRSVAGRYGGVALWPALNLALSIAAPALYEALLRQLPLYVYAALAAVGAWLYFRQIRRLIAIRPGTFF